MKHRCIWEKKDINVGMYVIRESWPRGMMYDHNALDSNPGSISYKVGYLPNQGGSTILLTSLMDGLTLSFIDMLALTRFFNEDEWGYRPVESQDDLINIMYAASEDNEGCR